MILWILRSMTMACQASFTRQQIYLFISLRMERVEDECFPVSENFKVTYFYV